ncbi:MAG: FG-GAP repeat protein, partial [Candidatus Heimdallarchaeota archaeon]
MRKLFYTTIISLSVCIISLAQISEFKIVPTDGSADDWFGYSVSISGDFSIVGAIIDDDNGNMSGSAYIFKREGANWTEQQKLIASDGSLEDNFGGSVSISEDYAIVGAHADDDNGTESGSAYIFIKDGTDWIELQKIKPSDGAQEDNFGTSVSISGDYTIIGAPLNNNNGILTGSAYIFRRNDTNWIQEQKLIASDGETLDSFGAFVSISGNYAVVGAPFDNDKGFLSGSVYIFERDDTTWTEKQKLTASDGTADDYFGSPVSISENYLIVGAPLDDDNGLNSGSAYIFRKDFTTWIEEQKVISSDGDEDDNFGHSVSISDNYAIVSTYRKDNYTGSAYIFRKI